jgi:hypothetical protein
MSDLFNPEPPRVLSAAEWNEKYPVGTHVRYWNVLPRQGEGFTTKTRGMAWELPNDTPVVLLEGKLGGIALSHLEVIS